jgi:hypothetical protein
MINTPSFLVVADRGRLLSYVVQKNGHRATPRLVESLEMVEGRQHLRELVTDRMGAFPTGGTNGQGNSPAERMTLVAEISMRTIRNLANRILHLLKEHRPETWCFAAPGEINSTILDELPREWRDRLSQNLPLDLTRVPATELLEHFG